MGKEYRAKVFKSGNSLALRLPKELGLKDGSVMVLREERAGFKVEPEMGINDRLDISSFWGKAKGMIHVPEPRAEFEERPSTLAKHKALQKG